MDQDPEEIADRDRIREEGIRLREIVVPEWKPEQSLRSKLFAAFKWPLCWLVGIGLVTILLVNLDKDPFVIGQETKDIEEIPFASIGVSPQGAIQADYYINAREFIRNKLLQKNITSNTYKNWTIGAANKLAFVIHQICSIQRTFLDKLELTDYAERRASLLDYFRRKPNAINSLMDNAAAPDLKDFVIPDLREGLTKCSDTVLAIQWDNKFKFGDVEFTKVITDGGVTCVVNSRPAIISQRNGTLKHSLGFVPTSEQIENWKKVNFDKPLSENSKQHNNTLLIQKTPGQEYGMTFLVQEERKKLRCVGNDGDGFRLTINHPREIHQVRQDGRVLPYGYEHFVRIEPVGRFLDKEVAKTTHGLRNCCLEHDEECKSKQNPGAYSQTECFAACLSKYILENCNCTTIDSYESGREFCNFEGFECYYIYIEKFYAAQKKLCQKCKPSCNDIRYLVEISSVPLPLNLINNLREAISWNNTADYAIVHVFYGIGSFEVTMIKERRLFAEVIGITTGMFGSAVEITLPKILDFCFILFGILITALALFWRKSRPYRRNLTALITRVRRRLQNRQIEPEVSIPMQIIVSSRTNLTSGQEHGEYLE